MGSGHGGNHGNDVQYNEPQQMQVTPQPMEAPQIAQQQPYDQINKTNPDKCFDYSKMFSECMKMNFNNTTICSQTFEDLKKCQNSML